MRSLQLQKHCDCECDRSTISTMSNSTKSGVENLLCNNATAAKISKLSTDISCDDFITIMAVVIREEVEKIRFD